MKNQIKQQLMLSAALLVACTLWTMAVTTIDLQPIGPQNSVVGFATINGAFHRFTGVHMTMYHITDWLGLVPIAVAMGFAILGLVQWIRRKHLLQVDHNLLVLGGFYIVVIAVYLLFEMFVVNYRPVLINGYLEASYPSSTTMLVMCVMSTTIMQCNLRMKNHMLKRCVSSAIIAFITFMVIGRLLSGVHWLSDIVGGALLSTGLVLMYRTVSSLAKKSC